MSKQRLWPGAALVAGMLFLGACGSSGGTTASGSGGNSEGKKSESADSKDSGAPSKTTVDVTAKEYEFEAPATIEAGKVAFQFANAGKQNHEMVVFRIKDDSKIEALLRMPQKQAMKHVAVVGGAGAKPGATAKKPLVKKLEPGRYGMVCFLPAPDKKPHFLKGMIHEFEVT